MSMLINLLKRYVNRQTGYQITYNRINVPKCFENRPRNVPVQQNFTLTDTQTPDINNDVQIPIENSEPPDNRTVLKVPFQWPVFIGLVSILQWAIFTIAMKEDHIGWFGEMFVFDLSKRYQIWRLLTNVFIHYSKGHLWNNVIIQLLLGWPLEIVHGWRRVLSLYCCSGIIGSLTQFAIYPLTNGMGASGAVYGLVAGNLAAVFMNWNEISDPYIQAFCPFIWILVSILLSLMMSSQLEEGKNYFIGHTAHISGALGGFIVGVIVLKVFKPAQWKTKISKVCFYLAATWVVFGLGAHIGQQIFFWNVSSELMKFQEFVDNYTENCTIEM